MYLIEDLSDDELLDLLNLVEMQWRYIVRGLKPEDVSADNIGVKSRAEKLEEKYVEILCEIRNRNIKLSDKQLIRRILKEY